MRIAVTGATGFLGRYIVDACSSRATAAAAGIGPSRTWAGSTRPGGR